MKPDEKKLIYISSPYTLGDVGRNVAVQMDAWHEILDAGHLPFAPLLTHYLHIYRQRPYEEWMNYDLAILKRMDALLRLPGESNGADREVQAMQALNKPVLIGWDNLWHWLGFPIIVSGNDLR
jgi:hypothetical protein